ASAVVRRACGPGGYPGRADHPRRGDRTAGRQEDVLLSSCRAMEARVALNGGRTDVGRSGESGHSSVSSGSTDGVRTVGGSVAIAEILLSPATCIMSTSTERI